MSTSFISNEATSLATDFEVTRAKLSITNCISGKKDIIVGAPYRPQNSNIESLEQLNLSLSRNQECLLELCLGYHNSNKK